MLLLKVLEQNVSHASPLFSGDCWKSLFSTLCSFRFHNYLLIQKKLCIFFNIHLTWSFVDFFSWVFFPLTLCVTMLFLHSTATLGICLLLCWLNHLFFVIISWSLRISYAHCFTHFISIHNSHLYTIIYVIVLMPCFLSEYRTLVNRHLILHVSKPLQYQQVKNDWVFNSNQWKAQKSLRCVNHESLKFSQ